MREKQAEIIDALKVKPSIDPKKKSETVLTF